MTVGQLSYLIRVEFVPYGMYHCCGSGTLIPDPSFPSRIQGQQDYGSRIQGQRDSVSRICIKDSKYSLPKNLLLSYRKNYLLRSSRIQIFLHPGSGFLFIPDPGSKNQKSNGSRIRIRNTVTVRTWIARVVCRVVGERGLTSRSKELLSIPLKKFKHIVLQDFVVVHRVLFLVNITSTCQFKMMRLRTM